MKKIIQPIIVFVLISLGVGFISSLLAGETGEIYASLIKPDFAPPAIVFPVVWTILYIFMGIGAGLVWRSPSVYREKGLCLFALQLAVNFLWPVLFFAKGWYFIAFLWLLLLLALVIYMTYIFFKAKPLAAYLQAPYIVWLVFAGVLNILIALTN